MGEWNGRLYGLLNKWLGETDRGCSRKSAIASSKRGNLMGRNSRTSNCCLMEQVNILNKVVVVEQ